MKHLGIALVLTVVGGCSQVPPPITCDTTTEPTPLTCAAAVDAALAALPSGHPQILGIAFGYGMYCPPGSYCPITPANVGNVIFTTIDSAHPLWVDVYFDERGQVSVGLRSWQLPGS